MERISEYRGNITRRETKGVTVNWKNGQSIPWRRPWENDKERKQHKDRMAQTTIRDKRYGDTRDHRERIKQVANNSPNRRKHTDIDRFNNRNSEKIRIEMMRN